MEQLLLKSITKSKITQASHNYQISLPYQHNTLSLTITHTDESIQVNNETILKNIKKLDKAELFFSEFQTSFILQINTETLFSFIIDENTGDFILASQSNIPVRFLCIYKQFFVVLPLKISPPSKNCVETLEDENWVPASYNRSDADFEHFEELYGRRDLQYAPAKLREVPGIWLLEPETVKNPFEVILAPKTVGDIKYAFSYFNFIFAVYDSYTLVFTRESGLFSLACEFPFEFKLDGKEQIGFGEFQVEFGAKYSTCRLQDRKLIMGDVYPFYDFSVLCGSVSCGQVFDSKCAVFYDRKCQIYEITKNDIGELCAPEIAGFTGEQEQILINEQNSHQPQKVVDLEDMQDGYDINNEVDLFRSDFSQAYVSEFKSSLAEDSLDFTVLFFLGDSFYIGVRNAQIVVFDLKTHKQFDFTNDLVNWQIQNSQLQIFTESSIVSPFAQLQFQFFAFNHGVNTMNVNAKLCYKEHSLQYYPNADYQQLAPLTNISSVLEQDNYLFVISGAILTVYDEGKLIFTQSLENNMKIISFNKYELKLFSTLNHYTETRKISVIFYNYLNNLLISEDFETFISLLPFSRFSITAFKHPNLIKNTTILTNQQLNELTELAVLPPAEKFNFYTPEYEISFWKEILIQKYNLNILQITEQIPSENSLTILNLTALISISFSYQFWPNNQFAREICLKSALFSYVNFMPNFDILISKFFENDEIELQMEILAAGSVMAGKLDCFLLNGKLPFNKAVAQQQIEVLALEKFTPENAKLAKLAQEEVEIDDLLCVWFSGVESEKRFEISDEFPEFAVSKYLSGEFVLSEEFNVPELKEKSLMQDFEKYCEVKAGKVADWDMVNDGQYKKFQKQIAEYEVQKEQFRLELEKFNKANKNEIIVRKYLKNIGQ